jgi:hypothetical protein
MLPGVTVRGAQRSGIGRSRTRPGGGAGRAEDQRTVCAQTYRFGDAAPTPCLGVSVHNYTAEELSGLVAALSK